MKGRLTRYHRVAALAEAPTPARRLVAACTAGALAFLITFLLLGALWGARELVLLCASAAFGIAAAAAAGNTRRGLAVVYGVLGALWLLAEILALALGSIAAGLG